MKYVFQIKSFATVDKIKSRIFIMILGEKIAMRNIKKYY